MVQKVLPSRVGSRGSRRSGRLIGAWLLAGFLAFLSRASAQDVVGPDAPQLAARLDLQRSLDTKLRVRWDGATGAPSRVAFQPALALRGSDPEQEVRWLLRRLEGLYGRLALVEDRATRRGPWLVGEAPQDFGGQLRVLRFRQELAGSPLDGAGLRVALRRVRGAWRVEAVSGRIWRDCPPLSPPGPGAWVVTPRPDGRWRFAKEELDTSSGMPWRVLRDARGVELVREADFQAGRALGEVPGKGPVPLIDLELESEGRLVVTDERGEFPGDLASLSGGLAGRWERVLSQGNDPAVTTRDGRLWVAATSPSRAAELSLYHHLVRFRKDVMERVPDLSQAAFTPVLGLALDGALNAYASKSGATVDGRRYEHLVVIGSVFRSDAGVIGHERAHALQHALGFVTNRQPAAKAIHEGLADYFGAIYQGSPTILAQDGGSVFSRNIDEDRHYPEHVEQDSHETGRILGSALWDARRALGSEQGRLLDAAVLQAVAGFTSSESLPGAAEAIRLCAPEAIRAPLERELIEHGLLPGETQPAPRIVVLHEGAQVTRLSLQAGQTVELEAQAWAPGVAPEQLQLLASSLRFLTPGSRGTEPVSGEPQAAVNLPLRLAPTDDHLGLHELVLTATDELTGKTAVYSLVVTVAPSGASGSSFDYTSPGETVVREPTGDERLEVVVGRVERFPLDRFFGALRLDEAQGLSGASLGGVVPRAVALDGGALVVAPEADEEGTHEFLLHAFPRGGERSVEQRRTCRITLRVLPASGQDLGELRVMQPDATSVQADGTLAPKATWSNVAPGRTLTLTAGQSLRLYLRGFGPGGVRQGTPRLLDSGQPLALDFDPQDAARYDSRLTISAPANAAPQTVLLPVVLEQGGQELARRVLRIVILPAQAAPDAQADQGLSQGAGTAPASAPQAGLTDVLRSTYAR